MAGSAGLTLRLAAVAQSILNDSQHVRRGWLHDSVLGVLKLSRNHRNVRALRAVVHAMGFRDATVKGYAFYKRGQS